MSEQQREAFEAWYADHHGDRPVFGKGPDGDYLNKNVQSAFNVWSAALSHAEGEAVGVVIDRLRGQLQNCVSHLERAKNRAPGDRGEKYRHCIEQANAVLNDTLGCGQFGRHMPGGKRCACVFSEQGEPIQECIYHRGRAASPAPQVTAPGGCIPVPRTLVERWANVDAFNAPKGAAMELKTIAQQMLIAFDATAPTAPAGMEVQGWLGAPSWADAPADAQSLACNKNGQWHWFTIPNPYADGDEWSIPPDLYETAMKIPAGKIAYCLNWHDTLELRPTAPAGEPVDWNDAEAVADLPEVHDALFCFSHDSTGDNGTEVVREVMKAIQNRQQPVSDPDGLPNGRALLERIIEQLEKGFVVCNRCGEQEDTATLDVMDDLRRLHLLVTTVADWTTIGAPDKREIAPRPGYAGVTVWVGDQECTQVVDRVELETCRADALQRRFDNARHLLAGKPDGGAS